jgi:hypothetical protein
MLSSYLQFSFLCDTSPRLPHKNALCFPIKATCPARGSHLDVTVLTVPDDLQLTEHEVPRHEIS